MAIIRNTASGIRRGRVGNTTYYAEGGRQLARVSQNSTNYGESARRSEKQQARRIMWANLVNFYKLSRGWMRGSFENKKATQSDYNAFMSRNLGMAEVALTKEQAAQGYCLPDSFLISEGSLRTLDYDLDEGHLLLKLNTTAAGGVTTVAAFTNGLIAGNPWMREGMQLSLVIYGSITGAETSCLAYEITLDSNDSRLVSEFLGPWQLIGTDNGYLISNWNEDSWGAWILSETRDGKTRVSTQRLIAGDVDLTASFKTTEQKVAAAQSYGVDESFFLESGSDEGFSPSGSSRIVSMEYNGRMVVNGGRLVLQREEILESLSVFTRGLNSIGSMEVVTENDSVELLLGDGFIEVSEGMISVTSTGLTSIRNNIGNIVEIQQIIVNSYPEVQTTADFYTTRQ